jgi:hypothetical protein
LGYKEQGEILFNAVHLKAILVIFQLFAGPDAFVKSSSMGIKDKLLGFRKKKQKDNGLKAPALPLQLIARDENGMFDSDSSIEVVKQKEIVKSEQAERENEKLKPNSSVDHISGASGNSIRGSGNSSEHISLTVKSEDSPQIPKVKSILRAPSVSSNGERQLSASKSVDFSESNQYYTSKPPSRASSVKSFSNGVIKVRKDREDGTDRLVSIDDGPTFLPSALPPLPKQIKEDERTEESSPMDNLIQEQKPIFSNHLTESPLRESYPLIKKSKSKTKKGSKIEKKQRFTDSEDPKPEMLAKRHELNQLESFMNHAADDLNDTAGTDKERSVSRGRRTKRSSKSKKQSSKHGEARVSKKKHDKAPSIIESKQNNEVAENASKKEPSLQDHLGKSIQNLESSTISIRVNKADSLASDIALRHPVVLIHIVGSLRFIQTLQRGIIWQSRLPIEKFCISANPKT